MFTIALFKLVDRGVVLSLTDAPFGCSRNAHLGDHTDHVRLLVQVAILDLEDAALEVERYQSARLLLLLSLQGTLAQEIFRSANIIAIFYTAISHIDDRVRILFLHLLRLEEFTLLVHALTLLHYQL